MPSHRFFDAIHLLVLCHQAKGDFPSPVAAAHLRQNPAALRRLLVQLRGAGLVTTRRGPGGGVRLARPASSITLADVYRATVARDPFGADPSRTRRNARLGHAVATVIGPTLDAATAVLLAKLATSSIEGLWLEIRRQQLLRRR